MHSEQRCQTRGKGHGLDQKSWGELLSVRAMALVHTFDANSGKRPWHDNGREAPLSCRTVCCRCPPGAPMHHALCALLHAPCSMLPPRSCPPVRPLGRPSFSSPALPSRLPAPHPTANHLHLLALSLAPTLCFAHSSLDQPSFPIIRSLILSTLTSSHRLATRRGPSRRSFLPPPKPARIVTSCTACLII